MNRVYLYQTDSNDPAINLAIEQYLFENKKSGDILFYLWQNDNTIVIGRYQNLYEEVNMEFVREHGIKIVRRDTGGGAVYHDLGNLNYSFITDSDHDALAVCISTLCKVLERFGIDYAMEGRNDILVNGFKISGTARYETDGKILYHGTLLINSNLQVIQNALTRSNKITDSKTTKSNPRKVGNLADFSKEYINVERVKQAFCDELMVQAETVSADNLRVKELAETKYADKKWTYGFQPAFNYRNEKKYSSGNVCVLAHIEQGQIMTIRFSGDFFSSKDISELEKKLAGIDVSRQLNMFLRKNADGYIAGISGADLAELFSGLYL
jgi:lipoate-protein ligase A